ncbi:MFPA protein, partial [Polypterus senegalus]
MGSRAVELTSAETAGGTRKSLLGSSSWQCPPCRHTHTCVFSLPLGVPLIDGGTVRLPQLIGLSRALDLILTGRPVGAQEALHFGIANRVVPDGKGLECALDLAERISCFPQECLRADRSSAYHSVFDAPSFTKAMQFEFDNAKHVLLSEAITGADKFSSGIGKGGKFF